MNAADRDTWASTRTLADLGALAMAEDLLGRAAGDCDGQDLAARQLAALAGIGYALLAIGEELADVTYEVEQRGRQIAGVAAAVGALNRVPLGARVRAALGRRP